MNTADAPNYVAHCPLCGWPEGQPWLTVDQVARSLAVTPRKVREMVAEGAFEQTMKVKREWRIHHESLDCYIESHQDDAAL